jgi:hypothetical protein
LSSNNHPQQAIENMGTPKNRNAFLAQKMEKNLGKGEKGRMFGVSLHYLICCGIFTGGESKVKR